MNFEVGKATDLLTYLSPSPKWIRNRKGILVSGSDLRCDHHPTTFEKLGALIEGEATNTLLASDDFSSSYWGAGGGSKTGGFSAPDGSNNAVELKGPFSGVLARSVPGAGKAAGVCLAFFAKSASPDPWTFLIRNATTASNLAHSSINLLTGTVLSGPWQIEAYPDGWHRVWVEQETGFSDGDTVNCYYGESSGGGRADAIQLWGADLFDQPKISSHITTESTAVTRDADNITLPLDAFPWRDGDGTLTINGMIVAPILNDGEDALDLSAIAEAAGFTHLKSLLWLPN